LAVATALSFALLLPPPRQGSAPLFLAAVMVSAHYGGLGPGLMATVLSALALDMFLASAYSPSAGIADALRLATFVLVAVLISSLNSARFRLAAALRRESRFKDAFIATLAHELRTPLCAVLNCLHALRPCTKAEEAIERGWDIAERQARQMAWLIDDLLDISRISQGKVRLSKQPLDLATAIDQAVEAARPLIEARRHRLKVSLPPEAVIVEADPIRMEQIVVNLLTNSARYTERGGQIRVELERAGSEALLRVQDNGVGLTPQVLPRVFDLFVQAENGYQGGLGIGLSLVRSLVDLHGGSVTAASAGPGRGSEFVVHLPLAASKSNTYETASVPTEHLQKESPLC
jgi:signal transduction histidine kinase